MHWCRVVGVLAIIALVSSAQAQEAPGTRAQPLYLQTDQLIYDTRGNRVIAQGNVEIYYDNTIVTADQVIYDQAANTSWPTATRSSRSQTATSRALTAWKYLTSSGMHSCGL